MSAAVPPCSAVADFRLIHNPRYRNAAGKWTDGKAVTVEVACWRKLAEHVAAGLRTGDTAAHPPRASGCPVGLRT